MIVRSKQQLLYNALDSRKGIVSPEIVGVFKNLKSGNYEISIEDRIQALRNNPLPGEPLYSYEFINRRTKVYPKTLISSLFRQFGQAINPEDEDFDSKFTAALIPALHYISCTTSIYGSDIVTPEEFAQGLGAFELIDETQEIVPAE